MEEKNLIELPEKKDLTEFLTEPEKVADFIGKIREKFIIQTSDDVSTTKSRAYIKSLAFEVTRTKTAIDEAGKNLVADLKELPKKIDQSRKEIRDALDKLKDDVRKPLTEWEFEQENARRNAEIVEQCIKTIKDFPGTLHGKNSAIMKKDIENFTENHKDSSVISADRKDEYDTAFADALEKAKNFLSLTESAEEAEKLRKEKAEAERMKKIQAEAKAKAEKDAELAILKSRLAEEKARTEKEESEKRAKIAAEEAERRRIEAEKAAEIRAIKAAEDARLAEVARQEKEKAAAAAEEARKEADKNYRMKVYQQISSDLIAAGIPEEWAKACIKAVNQGKVPGLKVIL